MIKYQTFTIDIDVLAKFKKHCIDNDLIQSQVVTRLIRKYLDKNGK
jgi:hypothetical protein